MRILLFRVLYEGPLFSETPIFLRVVQAFCRFFRVVQDSTLMFIRIFAITAS